ncbi:MAG: 16S rRNA (cytosine(1402)-N(4))-methyltransferase [Sphingobacteriales bacterium 17-39-43]|uniref:16S rRNA (cytosine(1402)-N(4))-methyltransferase RsmH n=1 Tax=Daejeonella sp. TaxID=2805397 RepID=UPI000BD5676B|nr:16S rRNA (cytosine(1402)-N(4))-methyltransferase RsmH [Daejeonella sp.]MCF8452245.1 16S rRNA (cytosine(1402)-N(4))-methyltransferase RsmH [Pedobacter sp.]OYY03230.1 MAG: 16S rRNA (cytosine(1402)-N(4))-methyltransferase [Sphingobacteriia bacterium 35-40-5]OYZ29091.1 MAG: 16S rRNA (cytosine(1402)-N(4))-methyltransferase [Sphingobacteriales bacterium 16-39-50]OZA23084.1 MAG: 16S rRNA (cytosine(1402)-N(4))-methyltransferase [Sphingobacteriales bacterium 17-39-43]OZA62228.1 MAG: 16S rRNA (cytosi
MTDYHNPVMLQECMEGLNIKPDGIYVDVTFGGGGHSREILKRLGPNGRLLAFDQDADAQKNLPKDDRLTFIDQNFRYLKNNCRLQGAIPADGILADLGVSSHQFDQPERGFSIRFDADLDMRMDQGSSLTAKQIVNTYTEEQLHRIFGIYGEIKNAKTLAQTLVTQRLNKPIDTVDELKKAISKLIPKGKENKYLAQVFQALRIEVNQELEALKEFLEQTVDVLKAQGRLVVMSYHSLEDRLVKNFIAKGKFQGEVEKDFFGNQIKPLENITRKAIVASEEEIKLNNRARSAKLRIAVKS